MLKNTSQIVTSPADYWRRKISLSILLLPYLDELAKINVLSALIIGLFSEIKDNGLYRIWKSRIVFHIQFKVEFGLIDLRLRSIVKRDLEGDEYTEIYFRVRHMNYWQPRPAV